MLNSIWFVRQNKQKLTVFWMLWARTWQLNWKKATHLLCFKFQALCLFRKKSPNLRHYLKNITL
ncbi:MAG TPA: hypothetical protein DCM08_00180 [Microscillaceae bacterium]|nr:hypothetical protein [Microscillaceae bacterium]